MTRTMRALEHDFRVVVSDDELDAYVEELFAAFPDGVPAAAVEYSLVLVEPDGDVPGRRFQLSVDGNPMGSRADPSTSLTLLMQTLNRRAIDSTDALVVHAGAVECNGVGLVLPAHMESGKTTLTAGLVRAGFGYLTDEAVAFDQATARIVPYPKPLSLDPGSWPLFPELACRVPGMDPGTDGMQWQVAPCAIRPDAVGAPCRARLVVFPKYEAGASTELEEMRRAEAVVELARNTFAFRDRSRRSLDAVATIVRDADAYRLTVGDLDEAVAKLEDLTGVAAAASPGSVNA